MDANVALGFIVLQGINEMIFLNGAWMPIEEAKVSVLDRDRKSVV